MSETGGTPVLQVDGASKRFGAVRAIDDLAFAIAAGECVGLVGHNGAGKSTLVNILNGGISADTGKVLVDGADETARYSIAVARGHGVRCVFQELSLCPNLSVIENARIAHASIRGFGWRRRAKAVITSKLDEIFPGHGIGGDEAVGSLSIAERQMVEIAMAFSEIEHRVRLVILDEPTSSLDAGITGQLLAYVRGFVGRGGAVILISHILGEILSTADRVVVMKDGKVVDQGAASSFSLDSLVHSMGSVVRARDAKLGVRRHPGQKPLVSRPARDRSSQSFVAYPGEIVGLAGLGGHGQTTTLVGIFRDYGGDWLSKRDPEAAFVAGDRHIDGNLGMWSILRNISVTVLPDITRFGLVRADNERRVGVTWRERIASRTDNLDNPILSLSGGNQQKALFARALASEAGIILMDDPMRGVDISTKAEVYRFIRAEAERGRTFLWYSTEMEELFHCDRVYVFHQGRIVAHLHRGQMTEAAILRASYADASGEVA